MTIPLILIEYESIGASEKEMLEPTIVRQKELDLNGMVLCNTCNIAMRHTGGKYSCANAGDGKCDTPSIGAGELLTRVMTKLVDRMVASGADARFVENLKETIQPAVKIQANRFGAAEYFITGFNEAKRGILGEMKEGDMNYSEGTRRVDEINNALAGLAYEAQVALEEWDRLEFIGEEEGIRDTVGDPRTYLESSVPDLVQELLELLLKEVRVTGDQAVIVYHDTISNEEQPEGVLIDRIPLN